MTKPTSGTSSATQSSAAVSRLANIIRLLQDNADVIESSDPITIQIDCGGHNLRIRAKPAPKPFFDIQRYSYF
jgi:hypothetical protein